MPDRGQPWENRIAAAMPLRAGFPPPPTALGKRSAFPSFPLRRLLFPFPKTTRKDPSTLPTLSTLLQAHPSMRICYLVQQVGTYLARETPTIQVLHSIKTLAIEMAYALGHEEWDYLG